MERKNAKNNKKEGKIYENTRNMINKVRKTTKNKINKLRK